MRAFNLLSGVFCGIIGAILTAVGILLTYFFKYKTIIIYQLDQETQNLTHISIIPIILLGFIIALVVTVIISLVIGILSVSISAANKERTQAFSAQPNMVLQQSTVKTDKFCTSCGEKIKALAEICPKCGVRQR